MSDGKVAQFYSATFMMPMPGFCKVIDPSAINNHCILWRYISRHLYIAKPRQADTPLLKIILTLSGKGQGIFIPLSLLDPITDFFGGEN